MPRTARSISRHVDGTGYRVDRAGIGGFLHGFWVGEVAAWWQWCLPGGTVLAVTVFSRGRVADGCCRFPRRSWSRSRGAEGGGCLAAWGNGYPQVVGGAGYDGGPLYGS